MSLQILWLIPSFYVIGYVGYDLIWLQQLKRTEKRWMRPSEAVKDGVSEEQMKTDVCFSSI